MNVNDDCPGPEFNDADELADLRQRVVRLERERKELHALPQVLIPTVAAQQAKWEQVLAAHREALIKAPELERLREEGILPHFAKLATRQHALEEAFQDLSRLSIENYTLLHELLDRLK